MSRPHTTYTAIPLSEFPRIAIADLPDWVRPNRSPFRYPSYARDFGIEQDFLQFLKQDYTATVREVKDADYLYFPVFWTRLHVINDYGKQGLTELRKVTEPWLKYDLPKFTICQYDDGPLVDLADTLQFLGSRMTSTGVDVPLLASPLPRPMLRQHPTKRNIRASFLGRLTTNSLRQELYEATRQYDEILIPTRMRRPRKYAEILARTKLVLCPRGYGGSSFRFYEALQMGAVPWLIGEEDVRPFKTQIDWPSISLFSRNVKEFMDTYKQLSDDDIDRLLENVKNHPQSVWQLGSWCQLVIKELKNAMGPSL